MRARLPVAERLWSRVHKGRSCWEWRGATTHGGYGVMQRGERGAGLVRVHRLSWELRHGPIPNGYDVCHTCDNPPCIRPEHLFLGTARENARDMVTKNRHVRIVVNHVRGERHPRAKLTDAMVARIRRQRAQGMSLNALAAAHAVSKKTILTVVHGRIWRHV